MFQEEWEETYQALLDLKNQWKQSKNDDDLEKLIDEMLEYLFYLTKLHISDFMRV